MTYRTRSRSAKKVTKRCGGAKSKNRGGKRKAIQDANNKLENESRKAKLDAMPKDDNNKNNNNKNDANNKPEKKESGEPNSKSTDAVAVPNSNKAKEANNHQNESELDPDDVAVQQEKLQDQ